MRKPFLKFLLFLFVFSLGFLGIKDFCQKKTRGFSLQKAISKEPFSQKNNSCTLSKEELVSLQKILSQPYHFFTRGLQCYVFVSEDDRYILKLFRWKQMETPFWTRYLPSFLTQKMLTEKNTKKEHDFASYKIAFEELKEETGTLFLHLAKTNYLNTSLCLFDPLNIRHDLPSDSIEFILQKKADLFLPYLEAHRQTDPKELHRFFGKLKTVLEKRIEKQICDSDISLEYNMGVLNGEPVLFDIGNLTKGSTTLTQEARLVLDWLKEHAPEFSSFLDEPSQQEQK
jgi:hypothetical protein